MADKPSSALPQSKQSKQNGSLGRELRTWFLLLTLIPVIIVSYIHFKQTSASLTTAAKNELTHSALLNKSFINTWMSYRQKDVRTQSKSQNNINFIKTLSDAWLTSDMPLSAFVQSPAWLEAISKRPKELDTFQQEYDYIYDILFIDHRGNVLFSFLKEDDLGSNLYKDKRQHPKFTQSLTDTLQNNSILFSGVERYQVSNNIVTGFITAPLVDEEGLNHGAIAIQITLDPIFSVLKKATSSSSSLKHYLVAEDGLIRTPYENDNWQEVLTKKITSKQFQLWQQEHGEGGIHRHDEIEEAFSYIGPNGKKVFGIHQPVPIGNLEWALFSEINQEEALASASIINQITFVLLIIITLIVFIVARILSRKLSQPLTALAEQSLKIAKDESNSAVDIKSNNEIGQLADAFNYMVLTRQANIEQLKKSNKDAQDILYALNEQRFALDQHAIVAITDLKGNITFVNQKFVDISGYPKEELIGKNHRLLNSGRQPKEYWLNMYKTVKSGNVWHDEVRNVRKDGSLYWVDTTIVPFMDELGKAKSFIAIRTDITRNKEVEIALAENAKQLELVVASTDVGFWDWQKSSGTIKCNDRLFELCGYPIPKNSTIKLATWKKIVHPEDLEKFKLLFEKNNRAGQNTCVLELRIKRPNGTWVWVTDSGKIVERDENNLPTRMIGTLLDITPIKHAQFEQEKVNQQINIKLDVSEELSKPARLTTKLHKALSAFLKFEHGNFTSKAGVCLYHNHVQALEFDTSYGDFSTEEVANINQYCQPGEQFHSIINAGHFAVIPADEHSTSLYVFPLLTKSDKSAQKLGLLFIYSENNAVVDEATRGLLKEVADMLSMAILQEKTRSLLKKASAAAEQSSQLKSEFLASMSHEIRTPMNGVLGMLGLMLNGELSEDQRHKALLANSSAQSLLVLINDILDFSKIEAGKLELEFIDFNLRGMLGEFCEALALKAQDKGLEIVLDVKNVKESMVKGDQGRIRQVLTNLVGNAIKFTHEGEIVIRAQTKAMSNGKMSFQCIIQDTGIGIPTQKIATLFDTFSQVDASTTREYGGTGLGLSICKSLCELMGGNINVCSDLGQGSTFSINIDLETSVHSQPVLPEIEINKLHLLIVDDNATNREVLRGQLEHWGATVTEANHGKEALTICQQRLDNKELPLFNVAFLDMQMPEMDGAQLGAQIRADKRFDLMKLVMMTSISQGNEAKFFAELGFNAYFPKPATTSDLFDALAVVVDNGSTLKQVPIVTHSYLQTLAREQNNVETISSIDQSKSTELEWQNPPKILLVEDNRINQQVALGVLSEFKLEADIANNGKNALALLKESNDEAPYTIVLMDCQMPVMDGYQATKAIRKGQAGIKSENVPIIAMTANAMEGDREKCLAAGMNDYLSKPIEPHDLLLKLQQWQSGSKQVVKTTEKTTEKTTDTKTVELPKKAKKERLILDKDAVLKRVSSRAKLLSMLVSNFKEDAPGHLQSLYDSENVNDLEQLKLTAHTFKGMAGNLGGLRLQVKAAELEVAIKKNDPEQVSELIAELEQEYHLFSEQITQFEQDVSQSS